MAFNLNTLAQPLVSKGPSFGNFSGDLIRGKQLMNQTERLDKQNQLSDLQIKEARNEIRRKGKEDSMRDYAYDLVGVRSSLYGGDLNGAKEKLQARKLKLDEAGIDSSDTENLINLLDQNPQQFAQVLQDELTGLEQTKFLKGIDLGKDGKPSAADVTKVFGDVVVQSLDDGSVVVKDISTNKVLKGEEAQKAIDAARQMEIDIKQKLSDISVSEVRNKEIVKDAIKAAGDAFDTIPKIDTNIANLEEVVSIVGDGANTGPIISRFPSFQQASIELDNLQGRLGLDVVQATTFGALSKGELDLAKSVALPTSLEGPALVDWANKKIDAQKKLRNYLREMAVYLQQGNSRADWAQHVKAKSEAGDPVGKSQEEAVTEGTIITNGQQRLILRNGQWQELQ